ncbi:WD40/YVTN/BNR-like repeat-containing protein [Alteromonas sp. CYL-A6]|uniref:WD40/YVTN/BNR-like repeat-containing protein n=1 Tax=Alteromonas nitratireducens TaxID=3390813 RepID=UPI0034A78AED
MKKVIAGAIAASLCFTAVADNAFQAPLVKKSLLLDVDASGFVVMVGERGHVLLSDDGDTFTQADVPTQSTLTATTIVGDHVWAVGHDAVILHSADKGQTWKIQNFEPDLQRPFLDVLFFDEQHGIAVGAYGLFYRTRDGGASWQPERHASLLAPMDREYLESVREESEEFYQQELNSILPHLNRVTRDGGKLYMAGEAGLLAVSEDNGSEWQRYDVDYTGSFFDIKPLDDTTALAVGLRGNMFVMREEGEWEFVNTCSSSTFNSILVASEQHVFALGNNGMLIKASRPLPVSEIDPYANPVDCQPANGVSKRQIEDKAALVNAVQFNGKTLAVTANGIKSLNLE